MTKSLIIFLLIVIGSIVAGYAQKPDSVPNDNLDAKSRQAYFQLLNAEKFSLGPTGYTGTRSDTEIALGILLKNKKVVSLLMSLSDKASPEGRLYALVGLRLKATTAYQKVFANLKSNYEPPERTSPFGFRITDGQGSIAADNVDKGPISKGMVVTDMGDLIQMKTWEQVVGSIDAGSYDKLIKKP